jgi:hypothetical protein
MSTQLSIQGSGTAWYVMDNSQTQGPRVCSVHSTLREAQRSTLNTAAAVAFDAGAAYVAPPQGEA